MTFWIFLTAVLAAFPLLFGRKERAFAKKYRKAAGLPYPVFAAGLYLRRAFSKYRKYGSEEKQMKEALLYDEIREKTADGQRFGILWCILTVGSLICLLLAGMNAREGMLTEIRRPSFGEEESVTLVVHGLDRDESVTVNVSGRQPDADNVSEVFRITFEQMRDVWLNGNEDFDSVRTDLNLPDEADNGIGLSYESLAPETVSSYGFIRAEEIPDEGLQAVIRVTMRLNEYEETTELPIRILPPEKPVLSVQEALEETIRQADSIQAGSDKLILPETFGERKLRYETEKTSPFALLMFVILTAVLYPCLMKERMKEAYRKRNEQMIMSYPGILAKMNTFLQAGMSIRSAWLKISADYAVKKKEKPETVEYAFEEMLRTAKMIENGMPEKEAYTAFGRRTGIHAYMKFGSLLSENITQGISGLEQALETEMNEALEERKNAALKKGEEAGTKLVFPMILMLGVVMIILAVPAFLSY